MHVIDHSVAPCQVRIYAPPKEVLAGHPGALNVYKLNQSIPVGQAGEVSVEDAVRLRLLIQARYDEVKGVGST